MGYTTINLMEDAPKIPMTIQDMTQTFDNSNIKFNGDFGADMQGTDEEAEQEEIRFMAG